MCMIGSWLYTYMEVESLVSNILFGINNNDSNSTIRIPPNFATYSLECVRKVLELPLHLHKFI